MKTWEITLIARKGSTAKVYWEKTRRGFAIPVAKEMLEQFSGPGFDKVPDGETDELVITLQIKRVEE